MQIPVPWVSGTAALAPSSWPAAPPPLSRAQRCGAKSDQVEQDIAALERNRAHASPAGARGLAEAIAFQRRRVAWLAWSATASQDEIRLERGRLERELGPDGLAALRDGVVTGLPATMIDDMAKLAIVRYAEGRR